MFSNKTLNKFIEIILAISISLCIISLAVKVTLNFRALYYFDINHLKLESFTNINRDEIKENYDILINYLTNNDVSKLKFKSFPMSKPGEIHFEEVKAIFIKMNYLIYICIALTVIGLYNCFKLKSFKFLKFSSIILICLPIVLAIPFAINFDKTFTIFHKIAFSNDYWLFDPALDPVINILPEDFFLHCAIMILLIIFITSLLLFLVYVKSSKKKLLH